MIRRFTNKYGVRIRRCCASCDARVITTKGTFRTCMLDNKEVASTDVCNSWQLRTGLEKAGSAQGRVKRKAYFNFLQEVRDREATARNLGLRIAAKSIEEIRDEFEIEKNSFFINL